jgi:hypothetical protein
MSDATAAGSEAADVLIDEEGSPEEKVPRRWMHPQRWVKAVVALLLLVLLGLAAFLAQSGTGQALVMNEILRRVRAELAGDLSVGGVRSETLLTGFTLADVRLEAEGGARVLVADSVVLRYSLLSLLVGSPRVSSTTLHGLDLEISRQPSEEDLNVERLLRPGDGTGTGAPNPIELGRISVRGGNIFVLTPADEPSRSTVVAPDGTLLRSLSFEGVDLDLEETVLRTEPTVTFDARLASFSAAVRVVDQPLVVRAAVGDLTFGDDGLRIADATFRLPSTLLEGALGFGSDDPGGPWIFTAELRAEDWSDLADLAWIDARIPSGEFRGAAVLRAERGLGLTLRDFMVRTAESNVSASGGVRFDDGMTLSQLAMTTTALALSEVEPWAGRDLPLDGTLSGEGTFSGTLDALRADGQLTFSPAAEAGTSTAVFSGRLFTGDDPGADSLSLRLEPFHYPLLAAWWPELDVLGTGFGTLQLDGRASEGIRVSADFTHVSDLEPTSQLSADGVLRRVEGGEWTVAADGEVMPFALGLVSRFRPVEGLRGTVSGPVTVEGTLDDLHFTADFAAGEGRLTADGSIDLENLGAAYTLSLDGEEVSLAYFADRAPEPSVLSGHVMLDASGFALDSVSGTGMVAIRRAQIGPVRFGSITADLSAEGGMLTLDTLEVDISGARVGGSGTIGLIESADGRARFAFSVDSLLSLRPMFMGDSILVRDGLSPLEEDLLRVRGIEPDTLPTDIEVRMAGSASGTADVRGHLRDLAIDLSFQGHGLAYRTNSVDSATVALSGSGLPDLTGNWTASVQTGGITWEGRRFEGVGFEGVMSRQRGEGSLTVVRREGERYFATGSFAVDSVGGEVALSDATVQIDDLSWLLERPSRIVWDSTSVRVDSLQLAQSGEDPARIVAHGTLARGGDSDFELELDGFHVEDATRILQREDVDVSGHVDLDLTVLGPAESPRMSAVFGIEDPRYGTLRLTRLTGSVEYAERASDFRIDGWDGDRNVLSALGILPLDLALADVGERRLDAPMDVRVTADSLNAGIALAYFGSLENVAGTISADLRMVGTTREPQPSGTIRLADGGWTISALGVRHVGLQGEFDVRPDRVVGVRLDAGTEGRSSVTGEIAFDSIVNPRLDLVVSMSQFQAVERRDIEGMLSGSFSVTGRYQRPAAEGQLTVDQGTLFVEEFVRAAGVVDLRDPTIFADGFAVDTTVFVTQPILASLRNPFLDNLAVDIDLSVPRDLWLRSTDMNVEIGGELIVRYDRRQGDLVMVGDLQALRGSYQVLGRTFEVETGTVSFLGQPGVNPTLNLEALSNIRRRQGDRLEVRAAVTGTLVQPLVTLSTTEAGLSQPDLVSYLLFGIPSGELGTGAAGQELTASGANFLTGAVGGQVGTALAQRIGVVDYFAVSQGDVLAGQDIPTNVLSSFSTAQYEMGFYIRDDVFVVLVLGRSPAGSAPDAGVGVKPLRGVRVELALSEEWFVEGFIEDRFLRASNAFMQTDLDGEEVVGVLVFRDWGFGSRDSNPGAP